MDFVVTRMLETVRLHRVNNPAIDYWNTEVAIVILITLSKSKVYLVKFSWRTNCEPINWLPDKAYCM
jgi:hypothetical protein